MTHRYLEGKGEIPTNTSLCFGQGLEIGNIKGEFTAVLSKS